MVASNAAIINETCTRHTWSATTYIKIILGTWEIVKFNLPNAFIFQITNIFFPVKLSAYTVYTYIEIIFLLMYDNVCACPSWGHSHASTKL